MALVTTQPVNRDVFVRYLRIVSTTLRPKQRGVPPPAKESDARQSAQTAPVFQILGTAIPI
jgi:hypothetical protein